MSKIEKLKYLTIFLMFFLLGNGCLKDDCNVGDTFNNISSQLESSNPLKISLRCKTHEDLPFNYYEDIFVVTSATGPFFDDNWQNDFKFIDSLNIIEGNDIVIDIYLAKFPENSKDLSLHFSFGDRTNYINCSHPGSSDFYYLDLKFSLENTGGIFSILNFEWKETLTKGGM